MASVSSTVLNYNAITCVAQLMAQNFDLDTDLALYTVPTGKEFTPFAVCISKASGDFSAAVVSFGQSTTKTDFLGNTTLSGVSALGKACWCLPVPATTPTGIVTYTAGEIFTMDRVTAAGGTATGDISVFGFLNDA